jgi:hypothetical protein
LSDRHRRGFQILSRSTEASGIEIFQFALLTHWMNIEIDRPEAERREYRHQRALSERRGPVVTMRLAISSPT